MDRKKKWTTLEAIELARVFEKIACRNSYHVALTGGCLYKDGERKDADFLFYVERNLLSDVKEKFPKLITDLFFCDELAGRIRLAENSPPTAKFPWVVKAIWTPETSFATMPMDFFFPDNPGLEYV